jgi:NAD(P)-dependent dehydrogenase (short-subunit alcohol dehydrogenase family)
MHLDLSSLDNVRDFAQQWRRRRHSALTVLVNNAGMNSFSVQKGLEYTADGFDRIWQARGPARPSPPHTRHVRTLIARTDAASHKLIVPSTYRKQVNYLSHFLLTSLLVDSLKAGGPSRVVNLSSVMHRAHMKATDFTKYSPRADGSLSGEGVSSSYSDSKLAMVRKRSATQPSSTHAQTSQRVACTHPLGRRRQW